MATMRTHIYVVSEAPDTYAYKETLSAYKTLEAAKFMVNQRAGVVTWTEHNSHGLYWEGKDSGVIYYIEEIDLESEVE